MSNPPNLADVAALANVSTGTASHVLNKNQRARIAPATRERVRLAAETLGYRPNVFAQSLLRKKTKTLGLMMSTFENPFFAGVARAAYQRASAMGYHILVDAQLTAFNQVRDFRRMAPWPVDGILIWATMAQDVSALLGKEGNQFPVVYLGSGGVADADVVTFNFYSGMRQLMDLVFAKGYRTPTLVVGSAEGDLSEPGSRASAFHESCREHGVCGTVTALSSEQPDVIAAFQCGLNLAAAPASERVDIAVCYNDQTAIAVYNGIRRGGLKVPQHIAVTGFDGIYEGQCCEHPLTTAAIPVDVACGTGIEMLIHRIERKTDDEPNRITLPIRLLEGETT
jgi:DNA-binding LacI/PurR family transcriptional regulator